VKKERILFLRRTYGYGGAEVVTLELLKGIDYEKSSVQLATTTDVFSAHLSRLNLPVDVKTISARFAGSGFRVLASWLFFLGRLCPQKTVIAEGWFYDFPVHAVLAACLVSPRQVYLMEHLEAPDAPPKPRVKHWVFLPGIWLSWYRSVWGPRLKGKLVRKTLAVCNGVREKLVREYGFPRSSIEVVYNGVDTGLFSPASADARRTARKMWGIPEDGLVIVSTARFDPFKKLERLIRAFGSLRAARDDIWLLLAGDGPLRGELEALARSVDPNGRVRFLGHISDVRTALHAAEFYALPSDREGFGIALVEAMACKLICLATDIIGPREIIKNGTNGFLVDPSYEGVLAGLRRALALSREERERMGTCARQTVMESFRLEDSVANALACMGIEQVRREAPHTGEPLQHSSTGLFNAAAS
jgi:glycosyltransferase involved in cell wall biosynthesis